MSTAKPTRTRAKGGHEKLPTEPFLLNGGPVGCLLVHGFTGTPYEMHFLGERLYDAGFTVHAIGLAGHGRTAEELEATTREDWYRSVEQGLRDLTPHCSTVVAVGLSLGGLLVLRLAHAQRRAVSALVLLAPALVLRSSWRAWLGALVASKLPWLPERLRFVIKPGSDIADPEARRVHPSLRQIPLRSVNEMLLLQREVLTLLSEISQPTLAIQGRQDHTVDIKNLALLQARLPNLRSTVILPSSYHVITVDVEKERVAEEVVRFLNQLATEQRVAGTGSRARPSTRK